MKRGMTVCQDRHAPVYGVGDAELGAGLAREPGHVHIESVRSSAACQGISGNDAMGHGEKPQVVFQPGVTKVGGHMSKRAVGYTLGVIVIPGVQPPLPALTGMPF